VAPNTTRILDQGGSRRDHRYIRDLKLFLLPAVAAIIIQVLIYAAVLAQAGRGDWVLPSMILATSTVGSAVILTALRRHEYPLTSAALLTSAMVCVAITVLSALRIPVSYIGLLLAAPASIVFMAYANMRYHKAISDNVALLDFPGSKELSISLEVPIVTPASDIDQLLIDPNRPANAGELNSYYMRGIEIVPWMRFLEIRQGRVDVASFDISHIRLSPSQLLYTRAKRLFDVLAVLVTAPITIILGILVAAFILLRHGKPILFVQRRLGHGGSGFNMFKFRTMRVGSDGPSTVKGDHRIFPGGRFLRRMRLDELPQLLNVLRGEMSLIGPRPVSEFVAAQCEAIEPKFSQRHLVLPGITGWAQVNSGYASTVNEEMHKLSYDLYYIKYQSFDLDLQIIFRTLHTLIFGSGAR
jgi:lipopolysaccharide/colanic/teichoic acid biosynthesis glycosyltransferase